MVHTPERMCVICRQRFAQAALTRYVLSPEGEPQRDDRRIMPGRGWYVCSHTACIQKLPKYKPGMPRRKGVKK